MANSKKFDISTLKLLEAKVAKLLNTSNANLLDNTKKFDQANAKLNGIIDKMWDRSSSPNAKEVENLLNQMQDEIKLEKKTAELQAFSDQKLKDRLTRLREDRPIRKTSSSSPNINNKIPSDAELHARLKKIKEDSPIRKISSSRPNINNKIPSDEALHARLKKLKEDDKPVGKQPTTPSIAPSFIAANLYIQAHIAHTSIDNSINDQEKALSNNFSEKLIGMGNIIEDIPTIPKEYEKSVSNIIYKGLKNIYEGAKTVLSSPLKIVKELGNSLLINIKSGFSESPEQKLKIVKENLKGLYKAYADLNDIKPAVKEKFLKNHYEKIDQTQDHAKLLLETAKVSKSIIYAGKEKIKHNLSTNINNSIPSSAPKTPNVAKFNNRPKGHSI